MRQKLGVIMAMLPSPALLVLDEPTTGIDPVSRSDLWRLIALAAAGRRRSWSPPPTWTRPSGPPGCWCSTRAGTLVAGPPAEVVASMPGAVVEVDAPADPGARPGGAAPAGGSGAREGDPAAVAPGLEDVVIVASLAAGAGRAS